MKERPILFSAPMVRAILAGQKTQTRRIIKRSPRWPIDFIGGQADMDDPMCWGFECNETAEWWLLEKDPDDNRSRQIPCQHGQVGDHLWVRESTHRRQMQNLLTGEPLASQYDGGAYSADDNDVLNPDGFDISWWYSRNACPSIHMPRWACRLLLDIEELRVERLQEISVQDALAEGIIVLPGGGFGLPDGAFFHAADPRQSFFMLWESINGDGSVQANPWVWAVKFRRIER